MFATKYAYDTGHGYLKEMVRENICCVTYSCQFSINNSKLVFHLLILWVIYLC